MSRKNISTISLSGPVCPSGDFQFNHSSSRDNIGVSVVPTPTVKKGEFSPQSSGPSCAFDGEPNSQPRTEGRKKILTHGSLSVDLLPYSGKEVIKKPGKESHPHLYQNNNNGGSPDKKDYPSTLNHVIVGDCDFTESPNQGSVTGGGSRRHVANGVTQAAPLTKWQGMSAPTDSSKGTFRKHVERPGSANVPNILTGECNSPTVGGDSQQRPGRKVNYSTSAQVCTINTCDGSEGTPIRRKASTTTIEKPSLVGVFKPEANYFEKREYTFEPPWDCTTGTAANAPQR